MAVARPESFKMLLGPFFPLALPSLALPGPLVGLEQILSGGLPCRAIQVGAPFLLYMFPRIGLWLLWLGYC